MQSNVSVKLAWLNSLIVLFESEINQIIRSNSDPQATDVVA
jgi:hypothetical protein